MNYVTNSIENHENVIQILCQNVLYICHVRHEGCCGTLLQALMMIHPSRNVWVCQINSLTFVYSYAVIYIMRHRRKILKLIMNKDVVSSVLEVIKIEHSLVERERMPLQRVTILEGKVGDSVWFAFCLPTPLFQASSE